MLRYKGEESIPESMPRHKGEEQEHFKIMNFLQFAAKIKQLLLPFRRWVVVCVQILLIVLANYLAFVLRFDAGIPHSAWKIFLLFLPLVIVVRAVVFIPFRLHEGLWRYTSIFDLWNIIKGVAISSAILFVTIRWIFGATGYPRSVYFIDAVLLLFFLGGVRLPWRIYREVSHTPKEKRVLIYGAGDAGEMIVRDMRKNAYYNYEPIGFIDDNPGKVGQSIHGVPVLGTRKDLARVITKEAPHEILVSIPTAGPSVLREILKVLEPFKVPIKTLPNLRDVLDGTVSVGQIRSLQVEDLLERAPVSLDSTPVQLLLRGKRILVTGAGGSIGSELCRQILRHDPQALIPLDRYENTLFAVSNELGGNPMSQKVIPAIGDVTDVQRMAVVFARFRPEIVFHAAAHKHVPLMEGNPCEAVKNNVFGTTILAEKSVEFGVQKFILISTDKAVNPSSVMGASKRVAELVILEKALRGPTHFSAVRFGNVLASNGSVIPTFLEQIKKGGPVTVTHPDMLRYFMLIPEAVQLVLHAAAFAKGGEIYVLDMGAQIKVLEMARNLIRLSGFVPEQEIPIKIIGLRPGEKLQEELVSDDEEMKESPAEKIFRVCSKNGRDFSKFLEKQDQLQEYALQGDAGRVIELLVEMIPTFRTNGSGDNLA